MDSYQLHNATIFSACARGHGATWCHGDCLWITGQCVDRMRVRRLEASAAFSGEESGEQPEVSCGNHNATRCSECPQDSGSTWCHGDCVWLDEECIEADSLTVEDGPVDATASDQQPVSER